MAHYGFEEVIEQPKGLVKELFELLEFLAAQFFFGGHGSRLSTVIRVELYHNRAV